MAASAKHITNWHVTSRVVAAAIPAFILANTASVLLALLLPGAKIGSVATAILLSFGLWTAIIMWVFTVKRLRTVWVGLISSIIVTAGAAALLLWLETNA
ncbi:MAG: hypothetical protein AAGH76_12730 [Pseudomonadota bacterium]